MVDYFVPASPKAWCNKCGRDMKVKKKEATGFWINTGHPKMHLVKLQCPKISWYKPDVMNELHTKVWFVYPTEDNEGKFWYLSPCQYDGAGQDSLLQWWRDPNKQKQKVAKADAVESFMEMGKKNKK